MIEVYSVPKKQSIIDFSKPFLCSVEGYNPVPITQMLDVVDEKNRIIITRLAQCDNISRNRCFYGLEDVLWSLKNSNYVQECISQGIWLGELEHPDRGCDLPRFMRIEDDRISHVIKKYWAEGEFLKGVVQLIPPKGDIVWRWITEANMNMAFSLRIYTPHYIKKKDKAGVEYVHKTRPMYPVTFDIVKTPGYKNIRVVDPNSFASKNQYYITNGKSDLGTEGYIIDWFDSNPSDGIKKVLNSTGAEDLNIVSDLLGEDLQKARAFFNSKNMSVIFSTEDSKEITMSLNPYIFHDVMKNNKK